MIKETQFASLPTDGWPSVEAIRPYFLTVPGHEWFNFGGLDTAVLIGLGKDNTEALPAKEGRIDVRLYMLGAPGIGVSLTYDLWQGRTQQKRQWSSKGDMRSSAMVRTLDGDHYPASLFIPFAEAWKAVKEFMETEGDLPKSIAWIANKDLPPNTFPDP